MTMIRSTIFSVAFTLLFAAIFADNPCRFEHDKGVIDLTSLGRTDGKAAFANRVPPVISTYNYSYNPCRPFSEGSFCENVAACQVSRSREYIFNLGTQESAAWNPGYGLAANPSITYSFGIRQTVVTLECSTNGTEEFEVLGEDPINTFRFHLTHKCACWNGCKNSSETTTTTAAPATTITSPATDSCQFQSTKGVIDLTTVGRTDGKATYADRVPASASNWKYSYNPCKPFSEGDTCRNVSACQVSLDGQYTFTLGTQDSAVWSAGSGINADPSIIYSYSEKEVIVTLVCSPTGTEEFEVLGEDPINVYRFRLTHKCACWDGCSTTPQTTTITTAPPSINSCRFEYPGKGVIDFSFIGRTDERAAYTDESTQTVSNFKYSYNPCRSFSQGSGCIGVSVCQISNDGENTSTLGRQESASWNAGTGVDNPPSVNYVYGERKVSVLLQCSMEGNNEFQAFGEDPINTYRFRLTHKCACWNGCSNVPLLTSPVSNDSVSM